MSFFKQKVSFSSKFGSFFSVLRDHSSVLLRLKLCMLLAKVAHQKANFQTCHCSHLKFTKFLMSFLEPTVSFSSNFASLFCVMRHNSSGQTDSIEVQIFGLSTARMKINQIPYVIFQATSQFSFKLCNTLQCHDT